MTTTERRALTDAWGANGRGFCAQETKQHMHGAGAIVQ